MVVLRTGARAAALVAFSAGAAFASGQVQCLATPAALNDLGAQSTSQIRHARGLARVRPNDKLAEAAARHACDMARRGQMTHQGGGNKGPEQRVKAAGYRPSVTAENIAAGRFGPHGVLAAWEASQGHLANILIPQLREIGIGRAIGADGKTEFWAAVYSAPSRR